MASDRVLGRLSRAAIIIASALAVVATLLPFTAKPVSWDELVYMGLAFRPEPQAWRLNRYAHVYALLPFVRLAGDPYVGARVFWTCSIGLTTAVLVRAALLEPAAARWTVLGLTLLFLAGQEDVFAYPGIAFDEYTAMVLITAAFCLAWTRIARVGTLSGRDAGILGLLLLLATRATELSVPPALILVAVVVLRPSGHLRLDRTGFRLAVCSVGGVLLGAVVMMGLDLVFLGDALFSLRSSNWQELLGYNFPKAPDPSPVYVPLRWTIRPETLRALLPYAIGGVLWARVARDARLVVLYAVPLALFGALFLLDAVGRLDFAPRYLVPALPILAFLPAVALSRLIPDAKRTHIGRQPCFAFGAALAVVLAAVAAAHLLAPIAEVSVDRVERVVATALMLAACGLFVASRARPRLLAAVAMPALVAAGLLPVWRTATALVSRNVQHAGEARFAGFYEVARLAAVEPDAVIFVSDRLYDGAIRARVVSALTRMNFNLSLAPYQIVPGTDPDSHADYAVVSLAEYRGWRTAHGADPPDAIISSDQAVVLVCLRAACPRRARSAAPPGA